MSRWLALIFFRVVALLITSWLVMLLLPQAFGLTWGFDKVLAGVVVFGLLAEFAVDMNKTVDDL